MTKRAQRSMDDEIRIAADRRGEVRVMLRRESEVSETLGLVPRLLHGPEHQGRNRTFLGGAVNLLDETLKVLGLGRAAARGQAVAERRDERLEVSDLRTVRGFVYAVHRWCPV